MKYILGALVVVCTACMASPWVYLLRAIWKSRKEIWKNL